MESSADEEQPAAGPVFLLNRLLSYGLDQSDVGIQVKDPPDFEAPFWTWVADDEPIPDEYGTLPDRDGPWPTSSRPC
ncbi:hypothetical protein [uncultured Serinicoccus sp.]|uniref:hypothetical protein n=1 Tax=uncultured Serinicoccus sp. TaxID=735514 RepID=UPI002635ABB6|nr:hypothetical protein [uncultured Serinicoccus sp.]